MDFTDFTALEMYHAVEAEHRQDRDERKWRRIWREFQRTDKLGASRITAADAPAKPELPPAGSRPGF